MASTYSKKLENWDGFDPVAYSLNPKVLELPLRRVRREGSQRVEVEITLGDLLKQHHNQKFEIEDDITAITISTEMASIGVEGPSFNLSMAKLLLEFMKEGIREFETRWFFYDRDSCAQDVMNSYQCFIVANERIVREEARLFDSPESDFDPSVFDSGEGIPPIWFKHSQWDAAWAAFWYRKFYKETRPGQLMVLRPDNPVLYFYPEGRPWLGLTNSASQLGFLRNIPFLLWILIALQVLIVFHLLRH